MKSVATTVFWSHCTSNRMLAIYVVSRQYRDVHSTSCSAACWPGHARRWPCIGVYLCGCCSNLLTSLYYVPVRVAVVCMQERWSFGDLGMQVGTEVCATKPC